MKAVIRDLEILKALKPMQVAAYLQGKGWYEENKIDDVSVWVDRNNNGKELSLDLPLKPEFKRFSLHLSQVLETLSTVEERSQLEIISDIRNSWADIIRLRVNSQESINSSIPLDNAISIFKMIEYSKIEVRHRF